MILNNKKMIRKTLAAVGFEPTPPRRLVPKTSALDRSATLPLANYVFIII